MCCVCVQNVEYFNDKPDSIYIYIYIYIYILTTGICMLAPKTTDGNIASIAKQILYKSFFLI